MGNVTQLEPPREKRNLRAAFQIELEQSGLSAARTAACTHFEVGS